MTSSPRQAGGHGGDQFSSVRNIIRRSTVERVRMRCVEEGFEAALRLNTHTPGSLYEAFEPRLG